MKQKKLLLFSCLPVIYSIFWIVWTTVSGNSFWEQVAGSAYPFFLFFMPLILLVLILFVLIIAGILLRGRRKKYFQFAFLSSCIISPVFVTATWGAVGIGFAGYETFLHWLFRYPNFGPINYEVLLGILCVLGTLYIPPVFAIYLLFVEKRKLIYPIVILFLYSIVFFPVFIRLDIDAWKIAHLFFRIQPEIGLIYIGGPFIRIVSFFIMITEIIIIYLKKKDSLV